MSNKYNGIEVMTDNIGSPQFYDFMALYAITQQLTFNLRL